MQKYAEGCGLCVCMTLSKPGKQVPLFPLHALSVLCTTRCNLRLGSLITIPCGTGCGHCSENPVVEESSSACISPHSVCELRPLLGSYREHPGLQYRLGAPGMEYTLPLFLSLCIRNESFQDISVGLELQARTAGCTLALAFTKDGLLRVRSQTKRFQELHALSGCPGPQKRCAKVGSEFKIDCSYLSPNVSIATSIERSTASPTRFSESVSVHGTMPSFKIIKRSQVLQVASFLSLLQ